MAILSTVSAIGVSAPKGLWEWLLLNVMDFVENYGWRIILFTVILKVLLLPLDFYQRAKMRKNQKISERIKPELEKLQKQYANDPRTLQTKQMEVNRREGYSYFSACIPMIITLVVFITLFNGMRSISKYMEFKQYLGMYEIYSTQVEDLTHLDKITGDKLDGWDAYDSSELDAIITGEYNGLKAITNPTAEQQALLVYLKDMNDNSVSFKQFIENRDKASSDRATLLASKENFESTHDMTALTPDQQAEYNDIVTNLTSLTASLDYYTVGIEKLMEIAGKSSQDAVVDYYRENRANFLWIKSLWVPEVAHKDALPSYKTFKSNVGGYGSSKNSGKIAQNILNDAMNQNTYDNVTAGIRKDKDLYKNNGLYIFVALTVILGFLSQFISSRQQKKASAGMDQMMGSMKMMMIMMPIMFGFFALQYTAAFTIYMVISSLMSIVVSLMTSGIFAVTDKVKESTQAEVIVKYGRKDPREIAAQLNSKNKKD
ncbi:MAG: YidC/Oxa1 family membrane protein insertase [Clostridia bacterium]|nr:YidC/Oxa1 family membrane protein insertase [Clostridia bacterium]